MDRESVADAAEGGDGLSERRLFEVAGEAGEIGGREREQAADEELAVVDHGAVRGHELGADTAKLAEALKKSRALATVVAMRQELVALWERSNASKEQLLRQLQDWCRRAEASGVQALVDFSWRLRSYALA